MRNRNGASIPSGNESSEEHEHGRRHSGRGNGEFQGRQIIQAMRNLEETVESQFKERPYLLVLGVGGIAFVLGAVLGSRIGRVILMTAGGYAINEYLRQEGGARIKDLVKKFAQQATEA